ncbi:MAG TPA: DUF3179 domain-containing (seleno)protein [Candidatus Polarisedimenticolaceae bacterium]|nr:DUF3179 domain-containing (seleno)protein [Candidatus Polarisedimenticolaceae bacterium]
MGGPKARLFTFSSGGWVLALALVLTLGGTLWNLRSLLDPSRIRPRGDGRDPASYGFDLASATIPRATIAASGMVADALPALEHPATLAASELPEKYLVRDDKVIGVVLNGEARCYPLRVVAWHEIVNDVVGGIPIAVVDHPLSHAIAVFDRRAGGETLDFGVSGLLHQSTLLMFDRRESHRGESLWSPLLARAVAGPQAAKGTRLTVLPVALARWDDWSRAWPKTRVLAPIVAERDRYDQDVYGTYAGSDALKFPVDPLPPRDGRPWKAVVFADPAGTLKDAAVDPAGTRTEVVGPSGTTPVPGTFAYWFAWYATRGPS